MISFLESALHLNIDSEPLLKHIRELKSKLKKAINLSVNKTNSELIKKSDDICKTTWKYIKNIKEEQVSSSEGICLLVQGKPCSNPKKVANCFNEFFLNIPKEISKTLKTVKFSLQDIDKVANTVYMYDCNNTEIEEVMRELRNKKSFGIDGISNYVVKYVNEAISKPLAHIVNLSMKWGVFPNDLKKTVVKPLFKKGDKRKPENYRPIALTSPFSKISEKIYLRRVLGFIHKNNVIVSNQFGYQKEKSCSDAIAYLHDHVVKAKKQNLMALAIFLDLSKAFDCVNHDILLSTLNQYGIRGIALDLITSYLSNRSQSVIIQSDSSDRTSCYSDSDFVKEGVPQGSIYGPYLFILYSNCIKYLISKFGAEFILYVDDTTVVITGKTVEEVEQKAIRIMQAVYDFFSSLFLALNLDKTVCMRFNSDEKTHVNISVNTVPIK